jgi:carbonic anhydrase
MFVHRNIANLVVQTDMNLLSVLQYAIDALKVNYLIVCGQYGCGGMKAALSDAHHGPIDNWLRTVKDTQQYCSNHLQSPQRHGEEPALIDSAPIPLSARARAACGEHSGWTCEQNAANVANLDG